MNYKKAEALLTNWRDAFDNDHFSECQECERNTNGEKTLRCNTCQEQIEYVDSLIVAARIVTKERLLPSNNKK